MDNKKQKRISFALFSDIIQSFVQEHYTIEGCPMCNETGNSEVVPDDYKGSFNKSLKQLYDCLMK